jgi:hypothetical protein
MTDDVMTLIGRPGVLLMKSPIFVLRVLFFTGFAGKRGPTSGLEPLIETALFSRHQGRSPLNRRTLLCVPLSDPSEGGDSLWATIRGGVGG